MVLMVRPTLARAQVVLLSQGQLADPRVVLSVPDASPASTSMELLVRLTLARAQVVLPPQE